MAALKNFQSKFDTSCLMLGLEYDYYWSFLQKGAEHLLMKTAEKNNTLEKIVAFAGENAKTNFVIS